MLIQRIKQAAVFFFLVSIFFVSDAFAQIQDTTTQPITPPQEEPVMPPEEPVTPPEEPTTPPQEEPVTPPQEEPTTPQEPTTPSEVESTQPQEEEQESTSDVESGAISNDFADKLKSELSLSDEQTQQIISAIETYVSNRGRGTSQAKANDKIEQILDDSQRASWQEYKTEFFEELDGSIAGKPRKDTDEEL